MTFTNIECFRTFCYQYIWYYKISKKDFCVNAAIPLDFFEHIDELDEEYMKKYYPNLITYIDLMPFSVPDEYWDYITFLLNRRNR